MVQHPDRGTGRWQLVWFATYALLFFPALLALLITFHEHDGWFLTLSTFLLGAVSLLAWRAARGQVGRVWQAALTLGFVAAWGYTNALVQSSPGDTAICYDRIETTAYRGPMINRGPDPACIGTAVQNIETN